eukprot:SAG31_NODE_4470_length_3205_cov_70.394915_2_plen_76_part_00
MLTILTIVVALSPCAVPGVLRPRPRSPSICPLVSWGDTRPTDWTGVGLLNRSRRCDGGISPAVQDERRQLNFLSQ